MVYAEISGKHIAAKGIYATLPPEIFTDFPEVDLKLPNINTRSLVLVANTRKTVIRTAEITAVPSRDEEWELVQKHFPLGEKMNENTHIFDGSVFEYNGQSCFLMVALPVLYCDAFAKVGEVLTGSIHRVKRLDTAENLLFRNFTGEKFEKPTLIVLPQENGFRLLYIKDNLPNATHYISNSATHRKDEFLRFYNTLEKESGSRAVFVGYAEDIEWIRVILDNDGFTGEGYLCEWHG